MDKKEVLIEVKDLKKYFQVGRNQTLKAVDGVNFKIYKGETLGNNLWKDSYGALQGYRR